ncbi:hypothetical protein FS749_001168 [Ceratobasidium sp. UAMH 11750]|nr:hypothetical protein FS749_001168 [Ceratobasidium sp. UAMH 11750]
MPTEPRHEFYETDDKLTLSVFVRNAKADEVSVRFTNHSVEFTYGDQELRLSPLRAGIDPERSGYRVGTVKIEIWLAKLMHGRWGKLLSDSSAPGKPYTVVAQNRPTGGEPLTFPRYPSLAPRIGLPNPSSAAPSDSDLSAAARAANRKNWDSIVAKIPMEDKTLKDDPNAGGDAALNTFFQQGGWGRGWSRGASGNRSAMD